MKNTAIILAGALARGGFEAGALSVITKNPNIDIRTIVATSSGALNGVALAAGIASQTVEKAMHVLIDTWIEHGNWHNVLDFSLSAIINRQGFSTSNKVKKLIKTTIEKISFFDNLDAIELKIVLTSLAGHMGFINGKPNTTFESIAGFSQIDFSNTQGRENIYTAACASSAFPGLFAPVYVHGFGACCDGGLVNDVPMKLALETNHIERIIIISPFPAISASITKFKGIDLIGRLSDVIVNERFYRDLVNADKTNRIVKNITALKNKREISEEQLKKIEDAIFHKREIEILHIRPKQKLFGNSFAGLFSKKLRKSYIEEGIKMANELTKLIKE